MRIAGWAAVVAGISLLSAGGYAQETAPAAAAQGSSQKVVAPSVNPVANPAAPADSKAAKQLKLDQKSAGVKGSDSDSPTSEKAQSNINLPDGTQMGSNPNAPGAAAAQSKPLGDKPLSTPAPAPQFGAAPAPVSAQAAVLKPVKAELIDGTHVEIESSGSIYMLGTGGARTLAPDGIHTLKDGTTFEVKNGKRVSEEN